MTLRLADLVAGLLLEEPREHAARLVRLFAHAQEGKWGLVFSTPPDGAPELFVSAGLVPARALNDVTAAIRRGLPSLAAGRPLKGTAGFLLAPILTGERLVGVIASDARADWSSPDGARLVSDIAALLAYAIEMEQEGVGKGHLGRESTLVPGAPDILRKQALVERLEAGACQRF